MKRRGLTRGGYASATGALATAIVLAGCSIQPNDNTLPGQTAVGDDGYTVTVRFDQVENLVPNSTVQEDNVVIGTVAAIDTSDWKADVTLRLLRDVPLPANAVFSIGQKSLLGAQYVEVVVPTKRSEAALRDGDVVPVEQTGGYPSTEKVLGAIALLLNNGGLSQISTITGELATAMRDRVPDTAGMIRRTDKLLGVLEENRHQIVSALEALDGLSSGLARDRVAVVTALDRIGPGLRVLEQERARLIDAVTDTGTVSQRAVRVVRASRTALLANLDALGPILTNLSKVSSSLPEALKVGLTVPFPGMTTIDAIKGDYINLFSRLDLRGSTLQDSWLGGLPPAAQAGDPVRAPLSKPSDEKPDGSALGGLTTTLDQLLNGGLLGPKDSAAGGSSSNAEPPSCLLALLGVC